MKPLDSDIDFPLDPALLHRLDSPDAGVRRLALIELADEADPAHLPRLLAALADPAAEVRAEAAGLLAGWHTGEVVEALGVALHDADTSVRDAAAQALGGIRGAAAARLLPWVDDPDVFVRAAALNGLREARLPESFAPALARLDDPAAAVRREAAALLGWLRREEALRRLARLAREDSDAEVRRVAAGTLGYGAEAGQGAEVVAALLTALTDAAWEVREEAATTLGKLAPPEALGPLLAALDDDYWQVRLRAARALGRLRRSAALPALAGCLVHPMANLRKEAAIALGEIGDPAAVSALKAAAVDPDPDVRKLARLALASLRGA